MNAKVGLIIVIILALIIRALPLSRSMYSDPTAMTVFLTLKQTVHNHYVLPTNPLSQFGIHNKYAEPGPIYLALVPSFVTGGALGIFVSLYLMNALFIIIGVVVVYLLAKQITKEPRYGIIAAFLFAISQIGMSVQAFTYWKGEGYEPVLLLLAVLFLIYALDNNRTIRRRTLWGSLSILTILISYFGWNGGPYTAVAFIFTAFILLIYRTFKLNKTKLLILATVLSILGWAVLFATPLDLSTYFGAINYTINEPYAHLSPLWGFLSNGLSVISVTEPFVIGTNSYYIAFISLNGIAFKIPYILFCICGFITSMLLAAILTKRYMFTSTNQDLAFIAMIALIAIGLPAAIAASTWLILVYLPIAVLAGASFMFIQKNRIFTMVVLVAMIAIFLFTLYQTPSLTYVVPPSLLKADQWIQNNTPTNSTFLSLQQNGADIEYLGNRTCYIDTDEGLNLTRVDAFARFLLATDNSGSIHNLSYLRQVGADYLLTQKSWIPSASYIALNAGLPTNTPANGTNLLLLTSGQNTILGGNITLTLVYSNTSTNKTEEVIDGLYIYKISQK